MKVKVETGGVRLDKALSELTELSRSVANDQIKAGQVLVNGQVKKAKYTVQEGDIITYQVPEIVEIDYVAEDIPFFLEILAYDEEISDAGSVEYAKVKPRKVIEAMKVFSDPRFNIDVLKVEVPVNVKYVEGFADGEVVYSKAEAADFFKAQEEATNLPYIYLSAGVSAKLFQETLQFAHDSGAKFNGVLCGRATWAGSVEPYIKEGEKAAREWLRTTGFENIDELNKVLVKSFCKILSLCLPFRSISVCVSRIKDT